MTSRDAMPREPLAAVAASAAALAPFADAAGNSASALAALFDFVRPRDMSGIQGSATRYTAVIELLEGDPARAAEVRRHVMRLLAGRRLIGFFADSGILPGTGFFTELGRIIAVRLLPEVPDPDDLHGVLHQMFHQRGDWIWFSALPVELSRRFWHLIAYETADDDTIAPAIVGQVLEAMLILAYRMSGIDLDGEFGRLGPEFKGHAASFRELTSATQRYVDTRREQLLDPRVKPLDSAEVQVLVDQCQSVIKRARLMAAAHGTSVRFRTLSGAVRRPCTASRIWGACSMLGSLIQKPTCADRTWSNFGALSSVRHSQPKAVAPACAAMLREGLRC